MDSIRKMGVFCCDAGRASYEGTDSLRLHPAGMAAFWFLGPKDRRSLIWSGWWTWLLASRSVHLAWLVIGCSTKPEFYNDVVIREFMSRFDQSLKAHEKQQPIWFYFPHLLHKFAPWSLLCSRPADHLGKCAPQNQVRPWDSLACVLGGWWIALHDLRAFEARGPNFPGNSPAVLAPCLHGVGLPMRQACSCLVRCRRRLRNPGGLRLFSHRSFGWATATAMMPWCISAREVQAAVKKAGISEDRRGRGKGRANGHLLRCGQISLRHARHARMDQWRT